MCMCVCMCLHILTHTDTHRPTRPLTPSSPFVLNLMPNMMLGLMNTDVIIKCLLLFTTVKLIMTHTQKWYIYPSTHTHPSTLKVVLNCCFSVSLHYFINSFFFCLLLKGGTFWGLCSVWREGKKLPYSGRFPWRGFPSYFRIQDVLTGPAYKGSRLTSGE